MAHTMVIWYSSLARLGLARLSLDLALHLALLLVLYDFSVGQADLLDRLNRLELVLVKALHASHKVQMLLLGLDV